MKTTVLQPAGLEPPDVPIDWTESEWFRVWLQLARRESPERNSRDDDCDLSPTSQAAAA
jgi:hypothetical protein